MKIKMLSFGVAAIYLSAIVFSTSHAKISPPTPAKKRPRGCDCYTVSGPDPGYFQHYKLWDFRAVDLKKHAHLNLSEPIQGGDDEWDDYDQGEDQEDYVSPEAHDTQNPDPTSLVFFKTSFERDWSSQAWKRPGTSKAPVLMVNSKNNIFLTRDYGRDDPHATYLVLRTTRHKDYTSTAEIETRLHNIYRCSLRVRLRFLPADFVMSQPPQRREWSPQAAQQNSTARLNNRALGANQAVPLPENLPPPGACAGIFTYHDRTSESDIEILTRDPPHRIHYANQPDYDFENDREIPGASTVADLPVPWTTWATHRLDWLSDISRWFVNDQIQDARTYRVPNLQSMIVLNLWSDGGLWTGDMKLGDSIYMGIEYIELIYNRSSDVSKIPYVPASQNHGGHQKPLLENDTIIDSGNSSMPDWEQVKCKPGKDGRECRKQKFLNRPRTEFCQRSCNIDEL